MFDRLYANAVRSDRLRKEVLTRIKIREELSGCTFTPQVCVRGVWVCGCVCVVCVRGVCVMGVPHT